MSVSDGQNVDAAITNAGFMDKNEDTFTVGEVALQNPVPASGANVDNVQKELNSNASYSGKTLNADNDEKPAWIDSTVGTTNDNLQERSDALTTASTANTTAIGVNAGNIATNAADIIVNAGNIADNTQEAADIRATQGTTLGDTVLPPFTGVTIPDNSDVVEALQSMETALEAIPLGLVFQGNWNASTNTPVLADNGVGGTAGDYYLVSVAGSTSLDGISDWDIGDWCVNIEGTKWDKIDNSDQLGANQALSNLTNPTAINRDLTPNSSNRGIGGFSLGTYWNYVTQRQAIFYDNTNSTIRMIMSGQEQILPDATPTKASMSGQSGEDMAIYSQGNGGIDSGDIKVQTGNTTVTGNTGNVHLRTGVPVGGVRGDIKLEDGSQGTVGHVWTSKDTFGSGEWIKNAGGGSGVGGKNYFLDDAFNFEDGTVGDWVTYSDTPGFEPVDGAGVVSSGTPEVDNTIVFNTVFNLPIASRLAQKFVPTSDFDITKITLKDMSSAAAVGAGDLVIEIHTDDAGEPSASSMYTSDDFDVSVIPINTFGAIDVTFPPGAALTSGVDYWFVVKMNVSSGGVIRSGINNDATDNYAAGVTAQSVDSGINWNVDPAGGGEDLGFTVFSVGVPDITFAAANTFGIRDAWVGRYTKPAINAQGNGFSYDFSIDPADKNTDLYYSFDFLNLTALINNEDITFWVRDIVAGTNERIIPKSGADRFTARYSTSENLDYRMIIHNSGVSALAQTFDVDTMIVGPTQILDFASDGPVGEVIQFADDSIPTNFLNCDGVPKNRIEYAELFAAIGTTWGVGDGSTTFGIPPQDYYLRGDGVSSVGQLLADATAPNGLSANQAQHRHLEGSHVWNGHTRTYGSVASAGDGPSGTGAGDQQAYTSYSDPGISIASTDGETRPKSAVYKFCIRFKSSRSGIITTTEALNEVSGARRKVDATGQSLPTSLTTIVDFQVAASPVTGGLVWQTGAGYNPATGLWATIPGYIVNKTGWHNCEGNVTTELLDAGKIQIGSVFINGVAITACDYNEASTVGQASRSASNNLYLEKGNVVSYGIFHNFGAARAVRSASTPGNYSWFSVLEHPSLSTYGVYGEYEIQSINSSQKTPVGNLLWSNMTGNSLTLPPGTWKLWGTMLFSFSGVAGWANTQAKWASENGTDTVTSPTNLVLDHGLNQMSMIEFGGEKVNRFPITMDTAIYTNKVEETIYMVPFGSLDTPANGRIIAYVRAERLR